MNRVAKMEVGEKVIVCGRSARWWNSEIKERIALRWQLYKKVISRGGSRTKFRGGARALGAGRFAASGGYPPSRAKCGSVGRT